MLWNVDNFDSLFDMLFSYLIFYYNYSTNGWEYKAKMQKMYIVSKNSNGNMYKTNMMFQLSYIKKKAYIDCDNSFV